MSWLAALALPLALWAAGRRWMGRSLDRAPAALLAGILAFYAALALLQLAGIPWTRWTILAVLALLILLMALPRRAASGEVSGSPALAPGWGDLAALAAVVVFALVALTLWATTPDFVYHWGLKAERFTLARAIDFRFLARPWNGGPGIHPDYPNLLPSLYAATALLAGRFDAHALMLWSAVWLAALLLALRAALAAMGVERWTAQAALAATAAATVAYGLGNLLAGGADWTIALALAAAAPALSGAGGEGADLQIGVAAAFAATSKIEGVPLAAILVGVHLLGRAVRESWRTPRAFARPLLASALPPAAAIVPWAVETARHGLWQAGNSGAFDWSRRAEIWRGWKEVAASAPLHGLPWALALLPLVWLSRRTRPLAAVLTAQALVYLWAYLASPIDPWLYVLSNGSRLAFQLLPATLVGVVIATEPGSFLAGRAGAWVPVSPSAGILTGGHPALAHDPGQAAREDARPAPRRSLRKQRVLFLCTHNSARSQMAEGILRHFAGDRLEVRSAGTEPSRVHPLAIRAMAARGIDIRGHSSKHLDELAGQSFDYVITVCDRASEACPIFPGAPQRIHWSIADPAAVEGSEAVRAKAFESAGQELATRIRYLLALLARPRA